MSEPVRILAVDYGDVRTGLAISDPTGTIVQPLTTLQTKDPNELVEMIAERVQEGEAGKVVVGLPLRLDGTEGSRAKKTRRLIEMLQAKLPIPVLCWDERLSSAEAGELLKESGLHWRKRKKRLDAVAAVLILRSFISAQRSKGDRFI